MSRATYFAQECPTCGRRLQVRVSYLGKHIVCPHCRGRFAAHDPENAESVSTTDSTTALLQRADELLASADLSRMRPR